MAVLTLQIDYGSVVWWCDSCPVGIAGSKVEERAVYHAHTHGIEAKVDDELGLVVTPQGERLGHFAPGSWWERT